MAFSGSSMQNTGMRNVTKLGLSIALTALVGCRGESSEPTPSATTPGTMQGSGDVAKAAGDWFDGDTIPSGKAGVPDIQILQVHENGQGDVCGSGKTATLAYKAMLADGTVLDPGTRPFTFKVGSGQAIAGWDVVVARMRVGDSFTILLPQQLAYGPSRGDLKFDMELLSVQ